MRTTMNLPDGLVQKARKVAAAEKTTVTRLVCEGLHERVSRRSKRRAAKRRYKLTTFGGGWVRPGVDVNNNAALYDLMDGKDAAS